MTKIDSVLKKLSDLYEFNRKINAYKLKKKEKANKSLKPTSHPRRLQEGLATEGRKKGQADF